MNHILPMEYVSLLSLYYGSFLNSFLHEAEDPQLGGLSQELA